jgi:mRNA-degrading endonuclease toxin of MazEF toxin-antitoxin module
MSEKGKKLKPSQSLNIPQQGEIWLVKFPKIKEFAKPYRPAAVISNNLQNKFDKLITVATLTTEDIENIRPFEVYVENTLKTGLDYPSKILTGYSFSIYKERLIERIGMVSPEIIEKKKNNIFETEYLLVSYY